VQATRYRLSDQKLEADLVVEQDDLDKQKGGVLIIGAYNNQPNTISSEALLRVYDNSSLIRTISVYLVMALSLIIFIYWAVISASRYKHHTRTEALLQIYLSQRLEEEKKLNKKRY